MRRNKIKKKYLLEIEKNKVKDKKEVSNVCDRIESTILNSFKVIGLILLLIFWGSIPVIILGMMGFRYDDIGDTMKVLLSFASDSLLILLLISFYYEKIKRDFLEYFNNDFSNHFKTSFGTWLIGFGIMIVSNLLIAVIANGQLSQNEEAVRTMIDKYPLYMAFQLMIYAPLVEEIIFRLSIREAVKNKKLYIFISGFVFGFLHVVTSLDSPFGLLYLIPYCSLGCIFAYLYQKTDNIFSTVMAHFIHNTLALVVYLRGL